MSEEEPVLVEETPAEDAPAEGGAEESAAPPPDETPPPPSPPKKEKEKRKSGKASRSNDQCEQPFGQTGNDSLDTEYVFYETTLKLLVQGVPDTCLKKNLKKWITKLFGAEYSSSLFKGKRNRYLCSLCLSLMNDQLSGVFSRPPPDGALVEVAEVELVYLEPAAWELCDQWQENMDTVNNLPPLFSKTPCNVHKEDDEEPENRTCPLIPEGTSSMIDDEFQFYMFVARPYIALMPDSDDRAKATAWVMTLCTVGPNSCPVMKCVRNDYMQALLGCVSDLSVRGLFMDYPQWGRLVPLANAADNAARKYPVTDPTSRDSDEFLKSQKVPTSGAFCYMTLAGELVTSSVEALKKNLKKSKSKKGLTSLSLSLSNPGTPYAHSTPNSSMKSKSHNAGDEPEVTELFKNKPPSQVKFAE